jgi:hypothetical protein
MICHSGKSERKQTNLMRRILSIVFISALVSIGLPAAQTFATTQACSGGGSITIAGTRVTSQSGCTGVLRVPDGVTEIATDVFLGISTMTDVVMPTSLTTVEPHSFKNVTGLNAITFLGNPPAFQTVFPGITPFNGTSTRLVYNPANTTWPLYGSPIYGQQVFAGRTVTFQSNGALTGDLPTASVIPYFAPGAQITMPENSGSLTNGSFPFVGWNTASDGTGSHFESGENFTVGSENANLFATWGEAATTSDTPAISGAPIAGNNDLVFAPGTWSGVPTPDLTYQWYDCTAPIATVQQTIPESCTAIDGATLLTFDPLAVHAGNYIAAAVTGQSTGTAATTWIAASSNEVLLKPQSTVKPSISGTPIATATGTNDLTAANGTWTGFPSPTFSKQWYLCDSFYFSPSESQPSDCTAISTATGNTLSVVPSYANKFISVAVRAESTGTSATTWWSPTTSRVQMRAAATVRPSVTGIAKVGKTLTALKGTWTGAPTPDYFTYQWYSCTTNVGTARQVIPSSCSPIARATGFKFVLKSAQRNTFVTVLVTATSGSTSPTSWLARSTAKISA